VKEESVIHGEKVRLRAIEREDIPRFLKWLNDPGVRHYLSMYLPLSRAQEEEWFERQLKNERGRVFAIETMEGEHIGNIGLHDISWKDRCAELGIFIGERTSGARAMEPTPYARCCAWPSRRWVCTASLCGSSTSTRAPSDATRSAGFDRRDACARPISPRGAITMC